MICTTDYFSTPATCWFNSWLLTTKASTSSDCIKHITFIWAFVIPRSVITKLNKPFKNAYRLILSTIDKESWLNPVNIIFRYISIHIKEHFNQRTLGLATCHKNIKVINKHKLVSNKVLYFGLLSLHLSFIIS